jgi:hypothetical protein
MGKNCLNCKFYRKNCYNEVGLCFSFDRWQPQDNKDTEDKNPEVNTDSTKDKMYNTTEVKLEEKTCFNCSRYSYDTKHCQQGYEAICALKPYRSRWQPIETPIEQAMTRKTLANNIAKSCDGIKELFNYKNQDYGADQDAFSNFRKTAQRIIIPFMESRGVKVSEKEAMFLVAQVLQDKHLVALSQTGINGNEVAERLSDVANYSLIMKAMLA